MNCNILQLGDLRQKIAIVLIYRKIWREVVLLEVKTTIASVNGIIKLLEKLLGAHQVRREQRFDRLIRPLHDRFQEVHLDYADVFKNFKGGLPREIPEKLRTSDMELISERKKLTMINRAIKDYHKAREQQESIRDVLRQEAREILMILENTNEQRYVYSLIAYFHENAYGDPQATESLDFNIELILKIGGDAVMETPSTRLLREINGLNDGNAIAQKVDYALSELNQRFSDVCRSYVRLQYAMIQGKS